MNSQAKTTPLYSPVHRPAHYAKDRRFEVIEVLEDWVARAPNPVVGGNLWSCLKYLGRLFDKGNPLQDALKAQWYLNRLIDQLENLEDEASKAQEGASACQESDKHWTAPQKRKWPNYTVDAEEDYVGQSEWLDQAASDRIIESYMRGPVGEKDVSLS